jgi:hypothetical protein
MVRIGARKDEQRLQKYLALEELSCDSNFDLTAATVN